MTFIKENLILVSRMRKHGVDIEFFHIVGGIRWGKDTIQKYRWSLR